jgi:histidine triad (HIT) family protein
VSDRCIFCSIANGETTAHLVLEDDVAVAFLDHRPVFKGHCLLAPRVHYGTLADLPHEMIEPYFERAQRLAVAIQDAVEADGSFVAINNVVSQSVPHLHIHVVPRKRKDGLRGFFWPRTKYASDAEMTEYAERIRDALGS